MADKNATVSVSNNKVVAPDITLDKGSRNVKITWEIADADFNAGWRFATNGVVVNNNPTQFYDGGPDGANGKKYKWKDKNEDNVSYPYTVYLTKGGVTIDSDPAIQNQAN